MTAHEDRRREREARGGRSAVGETRSAGRRAWGESRLRNGLDRARTKHFLLGLSYGFALGFVLASILFSHA